MTPDDSTPDHDDLPLNGTDGDLERSEHERTASAQWAGPASVADRYATLTLEHSDIVIYDRDRPQAWIQSDTTARLGGSEPGGEPGE